MKLLILLSLGACTADKDTPTETADDSASVDDSAPGDDSADDSADDSNPDSEAVPGCEEDAAGEIPDGVTWIKLDGASSSLLSFDRTDFSPYTGNGGTYDLNDQEVLGANGFKLDRPGTVVAVSASWDGLGDEPEAATVWLWPDFGSDGYVFDTENPIETATRCLDSGDLERWIDYLLPEPIRVDQPLHVFAGYSRDPDVDGPDLLFENTYNSAEPFYAGARFPNVDRRYLYLGAGFPWYTWQIRLGVLYDDPIDDSEKLFSLDDILSVSARVAWGDYDGDGDDDLMVNGPSLYRNEGDGSFTDVTTDAIPSYANSTGGGVWGDYDNDGCLDYFGQGGGMSAGELVLHNNCDGTLSDLTEESGINDLQTERDCNDDGEAEHSPTEGAAWLDIDGDGFLDLYLANYECSSDDTADVDYFNNYNDKLWRNNGDGSFTDVTETAGVDLSNQAGRGATTLDADQDGWTDLYISNYRLDRNFFYQNNGDGTITDIASANGTTGTYTSRYDSYGHTIGTAVGDIDNDGDFDLVAANLAHPFYYMFSDRTNILINDGAGNFTNEADSRGIYYRETHSNPTLFDADNDGDLDLFITSVYPERDSDLYINDGSGNFTLYNAEGGLMIRNGWGSAAADYDQDGDVDIVAYSLFTNHAAESGAHWLQVTAVGGMRGGDHSLGDSNYAAIGAVIRITADGTSQLRSVSGGSGTSSQDSLTQHFGMGASTTADLRVLFPGGATVALSGLDVDQRVWVCEDGRWQVDTNPCDAAPE